MSRFTAIGLAAALTVALLPLSASAGSFKFNQQSSKSVFIGDTVALNPQPLPPKMRSTSRFSAAAVMLNPQPLPPRQ